MKKTTFNWIGSLISTISGAVAGVLSATIGPMASDPDHFNLGPDFHRVLLSAMIGAGITITITLMNFLAKSPLPGWTNVTTEEVGATRSVISDPAGNKVVVEQQPSVKTTTVTSPTPMQQPPETPKP